MKNQFPEGLINTVLKKYPDKIRKFTPLSTDSKPPDCLCTLYLALFTFTKRKLHTLVLGVILFGSKFTTLWLNGIVKILKSHWYFLPSKLKTQ